MNRNLYRLMWMQDAVPGRTVLGMLLIALASMPSAAQETLRDVLGSTYREKMVFAVYDFPSVDIQPAEIERVVLNAIRLYARDASVRHGIPPATPYPAQPGRMMLQEQGNGRPKTVCSGEIFSLSGLDTSGVRYGEITGHRACLFPYARGYRLNYIAIYGQQSGIGNPNHNVAAAMAGRALANLFGIGDSSKFIVKILDRMESGFKDVGMPFRLVQLHPANMEGRTVVADDLPAQHPDAGGALPAPQGQTTLPQPVMAGGNQTYPPQQNLPSELEKLRQTLIEQRDLARQQMAQGGSQSTYSQDQMRKASARKELHAMGFQYFSREQFLEAIKRGDRLIVELFVSAGGVSLSVSDNHRQTPLRVAEDAGQNELAEFLRSKGAK